MLREEIIRRMPAELAGRIDVYVLDVSREKVVKRNENTVRTSAKKALVTSAALTKSRTKTAQNARAKSPTNRAKKGSSRATSKKAVKKGAKTEGKRSKKGPVVRPKTSGNQAKRMARKRKAAKSRR